MDALVYVDDIVITGSTSKLAHHLINKLPIFKANIVLNVKTSVNISITIDIHFING